MCTFICHTGGVTEAAAMTEGLNRGVLITERLHISMLPPWEKKKKTKRQMDISRGKIIQPNHIKIHLDGAAGLSIM